MGIVSSINAIGSTGKQLRIRQEIKQNGDRGKKIKINKTEEAEDLNLERPSQSYLLYKRIGKFVVPKKLRKTGHCYLE